MPDRYAKIIDKSDLKIMNEKSINLTYIELEEIKSGKIIITLRFHNIYFLDCRFVIFFCFRVCINLK